MVYFLYGPNEYLLKAKVAALKKRFLATDSSGVNLAEIDGAETTMDIFLSAVSTAPFLSNSRLIIIKNLLKNKDNILKKQISEYLPKIPSSSIVFFVDPGEADYRSVLFKALVKNKTAQKFDLLDKSAFINWVKATVEDYGVQIDKASADQLNFYVGGDLYRAKNEIEKLVLYKKSLSPNKSNLKIEKEDIAFLVSPQISSNIFDFVEALSQKNKKNASLAIDRLLKDGKNELYILTMVVREFRNLLIISDFKKSVLSQNEITRITKLHPFVVKKAFIALKRFDQKTLEEIYFFLADLDHKIKSGQVSIELAIWVLIDKICATQ